jgi:3D (Asp-Asp-Asp) domain-containing protein/septal ring factor EnvC (AmiA/AmiB activator)
VRPGFHLLIAAFLAAATLLAGTVAHADESEELQGEAARLESENAELDEAAHRVLLDLYSLEAQLGRATRRAQQLGARIEALEDEQQRAERQLRIAQRAEEIAQQQLADRLTALYVEGEPDPLEIILGAASLDEAISAVDSLSRLAEEDARISSRADDAARELQRALDQLAGREHDLRRAAAEAEAAQSSLAAARDEKASYLSSLERAQALNATEVSELEAQAARAEERTRELESALPEPAQAQTEPVATTPVAAPVSDQPSGSGRQLTVDAVAYSLPGRTASGLPVGNGVVAVDPTVIPLGTRMYVPGYGPAIAADVGTAIKGLIIDLWFPTYEQAVSWGRRTVTITIYG